MERLELGRVECMQGAVNTTHAVGLHSYISRNHRPSLAVRGSQSLGRRVSVTASLVDVALKWKQGVLLVSGTYTKAEQNKVVMTYRRGRRCDVTCFYSFRGRCGVRSATMVHALRYTVL